MRWQRFALRLVIVLVVGFVLSAAFLLSMLYTSGGSEPKGVCLLGKYGDVAHIPLPGSPCDLDIALMALFVGYGTPIFAVPGAILIVIIWSIWRAVLPKDRHLVRTEVGGGRASSAGNDMDPHAL